MKKKNMIKIHALWDNEAQVWVAESHDVPGLATEADTMEILIKKLRTMIPELLEVNGLLNQAKTVAISSGQAKAITKSGIAP